LDESVNRKVLSWLVGRFDSNLNHEINTRLDIILSYIYLSL
jgi:hypothetical protein